MASTWTLTVNAESFGLSEAEAGQMKSAVEEAMRAGMGWLSVGDVEVLITPATQVSLRPARSTRVRL
jgi:hypothetical protein